ncbi:MAG: hypothetical protein SOZ02_09395 [Hallerella porci]|uniref:DUF2279 domain-containing protein n=1 Tax=Hallerella porci TaxID=1945871 RepID=A0ABX5LSI9_9BACT|nr:MULTISPECIES: hypothetical protein [Hallerella]MCI5600244.1 YfiM family protein [Hallerella sp.]MDY3922358.1 hypothetical protein [Hallerella porci]PWL03420.1 hypothetical protein B0H50_10678 [Hallerella porci]
MKIRSFLFLILFFAWNVFAQGEIVSADSLHTDSSAVKKADSVIVPYSQHWRDTAFDYRSEDPGSDSLQKFSGLKFGGMVTLTASAYVAAYALVFAKGWWDDEHSHFHFENDFEYAKNLDKAGHFGAGVFLAEGFYQGYYWSGLSELQSYLAAGLSAMATHIAIDVKDGYSPEWGFSIFDVLAGSLGGFYPMAKRYVPFFKYIDFKYSYWINSRAYYRQSDTGVFTDDYCNETFWLSFKIHRMLPASIRWIWPEWFAIAGGWSIDEGVFEHKKGHHEFFVALDYDLEGIFKPHERWARNVVRILNYIKLPAPTVQVYPDVKFFWLYPIKF